MIADRTKAALQAAKNRGIRLGRNGADRLAPLTAQRQWSEPGTLLPSWRN
jgi:DNA invertase Pin-like site-specific DNA recombinase